MENQGSSASGLQDISVSGIDKISNPFPNQIDVIEETIDRANESVTYYRGAVFTMSKEELKIRSELEIEIESGLEEEIREEMCCLALRLHRLYQHQYERNAATSRGKPPLSDVNYGSRRSIFPAGQIMTITFRMEGGSKIGIKEIKKGTPEKHCRSHPRTSYSLYEYKQGKMSTRTSSTKKFKWETTLRSGNSTATIIKSDTTMINGKSLELGWKS